MTASEYIQVTQRDLPYSTFDADNQLVVDTFRNTDAFQFKNFDFGTLALILLFGLFPALHSTRPNLTIALKGQAGQPGGVIEREAPIHISNVMLFNPSTGKGERVGFKVLEDGRKLRVFRSSGEAIDG